MAAQKPATNLVDQAYNTIKENILGNWFAPGFQTFEQKLAEQLGMSRTPIREALIRLQDDGFVEVVPRRGMRVTSVSVEDMREIYEVLTSLEVAAVERLAMECPDDEFMAPLNEALAVMERAVETNDLEAWAVGDGQFHEALLSLCGNQRLATMASSLTDHVRRARILTLHKRPSPALSNQEHREVMEALRQANAPLAGKLHRGHRQRTAQVLLAILKRELAKLEEP